MSRTTNNALARTVTGLACVCALIGCGGDKDTREFGIPGCELVRTQGNFIFRMFDADVPHVAARGTPEAMASMTWGVAEIEGNTQLTIQGEAGTGSYRDLEVDLYCAGTQEIELLGKVRAFVRMPSQMRKIAVYGQSQLDSLLLNTDELTLRSAGDASLSFKDVTVETVNAGLSGKSQMTLNGTATSLEIEALGQSVFKGEGIPAQTVKVMASNQSQVRLNATAHLSGQASEQAQVTYRAQPATEVTLASTDDAKLLPVVPPEEGQGQAAAERAKRMDRLSSSPTN